MSATPDNHPYAPSPAPIVAPNGTTFGAWLLNAADNSDLDGDGRAEPTITSPRGLEPAGSTLAAPMMAPNRTRFGGRLLNTADNRPSTVADYDGDARPGILIKSRLGIGILEPAGGSVAPPTMQRDGSRLGGRLLNTIDIDVGHGV